MNDIDPNLIGAIVCSVVTVIAAVVVVWAYLKLRALRRN